MLIEDYTERVAAAAGYITRLLSDTGTRVDNPADERIGPDDLAFAELESPEVISVGRDPGDGISVAAVDGGSACLVNGRAFWVVAFRAGTIWHRGRDTFKEDIDPLEVRALTSTDARAAYAAALAAAGVVRDQELGELGGVVDSLRELAEWAHVHRAIAAAAPGDVVLVDGTLLTGPFLPVSLVAPIHAAAREAGIDLVGVTKASQLRWGRYAPLVLRVRRLAEAAVGRDQRWVVPVTRPDRAEGLPDGTCEVSVARLAPRGAYAFRVDTVRGHRTTEELFALLAGLADDPAFLGYPYPLARVHQSVSLPGHLLADLRRELREACLREGLSEDDADLVLRDFHLTLNA